MYTVQITEENMDEYENFIPADIVENIPRTTYYGLAVHGKNDEVDATLVGEFKNIEDDEKDTISRIHWINASNSSSEEALFSEYNNTLADACALRSEAEIAKSEAGEMPEILRNEGFAMSEREGESMVVTIKDLAGLSVVHKTKVPSHIRELDTLISRSFKRGIVNCVFHTKRELLEDLVTLPLEWYDPHLSCYASTDDSITGFLLVHKLPSGSFRVEFMNSSGPDAQTDLLYMVRYSILKAVATCPPDTSVILPRRDEAARKLTEYFFPKVAGEQCYYGERSEN